MLSNNNSDDAYNLTKDHQNLTRVSSISTTFNNNNNNNNISSSSSSNTTRTMEEVWNNINLTATNHGGATGKGYRGFILQDFLAKPFSSNDVTATSVDVSSPGYGTPSPPPPPQQPLFNLNTGPEQMNFLTDDDHVLVSANSSSGLLGNNINIGGLRMLPVTDRNGGGGGDRRHKRMIKNRESAARSRARKQAYTNELENEVERLKEENAMLKRQQQQVQAATASQMTKKRGLQRTSTAPF